MIKKSIKIGEKFNKLTIIKEVNGHIRKNGYKERKVLCRCKCGNIKEILYYSVKSGKTKSCGCLRKEKPNRTTHGMARTRFYNIFIGMKSRCNNKRDTMYKYYGSKNIKCKWENFEEFKKDMYLDYQKHCKEFGIKQTTIDRIDNEKGYLKENCRWATIKEQHNNMKRNVLIIYQNKTQTIMQWAEELNIAYYILQKKIKKIGENYLDKLN